MKTLGETVKEFLETNEWNATRLAAEVTKYNGGKLVSRQSIQNLWAKNIEAPHYIAALAAAMGTTVETLKKKNGVFLLPRSAGLGAPVELDAHTVTPIVGWSHLMALVMARDLPNVFKVVVPDHAMAPRFKKGAMVEFTQGIAPEPGDGVLVRDRAGKPYFREYRERRAGVWAAHADNTSFQVMDAETEGLTVLAVLTGWSGRLSE